MIIEIKNLMEWFKKRVDTAEDRISELEMGQKKFKIQHKEGKIQRKGKEAQRIEQKCPVES